MRGKKRQYDQEFQDDAVKLLGRGDRSATALARDLGLPVNTLLYWYKQAMAKKRTKPARPPAAKQQDANDAESPEEKIARLEGENAALRKKNAQLEVDRAILKKAAAFFAKESE
jgi:transposase